MTRVHSGVGVAAVLVCAGAAAAGGPGTVIFAFDQNVDLLLRVEDRNNDGDTLDLGEVIRFIDDTIAPSLGVENAQGVLAISPTEVLITDNFPPDNIVRLRDLNNDGDAFDVGEQTVYWSGDIGGGLTITNPVCLSRGPDNALYIVDNNQLDATRPAAVYKLKDLNNDGDVDDAGEATTYFQLSPIGVQSTTIFDIEFDAAGAGYVLDITDPSQIESIDRIDPTATTKTEWLSSSQLFVLTGLVIEGANELTYIPSTDEIVGVGVDGQLDTRFLAYKDRNGNNVIDAANEIRLLWNEDTNADGVQGLGLPRDFYYGPDGSITFVDALNDRIYRLVDANSDGDYNDVGETFRVYDSAAALANGQQSAPNLLSVSLAVALPPPPCDGDANGDNLVNAADLSVLLSNFGQPAAGPSAGDFNADGQCNAADLSILLARFGSAC